ncbi:DUF2171 domain-containing protein [Sphingomonas immobilis]|uniref:DUF2171 domain-containing protein n=1 Tax=Sphingomonas immobilis TaxID=3063997 RepID=A0ABT8ZTD4_9SPHN|nr:DUF2171 domain-containing protein [Sphingomonas sp. CA1-15]MDO7840822.1 DUF2171 domain-containing protein [Sphingomonas sp. CA1-15]
MGYERYPQNSNLGDYYNRQEPQDYGRDYGSGRDYSYSSARDYQAAGAYDRDRNRRDIGYGNDGRGGYGSDYRAGYGSDRSFNQERGYGQQGYGRDYYGSYASDGHRFTETGRNRDADRDRGYGRQPQGYDYDDRGFFNRAGDEVRSWFGDEDAQRRRERDAREDERYYRQQDRFGRDDDYHQWRRTQIDALDRDYDEYRRENHSKFSNEFGTWRTERQGQRGSLSRVKEHQDVVGSDGQHVGTVDKVRGDRIILTKNDAEAGGRHHSIPSRWIETVDDNQVKIRKTADEAHAHWRDEERNQAFFGEDQARGAGNADSNGPHVLNRSFSGTY